MEARAVRDLAATHVVLTCMPVFHVAGTNVGMIPLANGCTNVLREEANLAELLKIIPKHGITVLILVPANLALVQHPDAARSNLGSVRRLIYGASPIAD